MKETRTLRVELKPDAAQNILHEGLTGEGKLRVNDAEGAEANQAQACQVERPKNRQGHEAENRPKEDEVKEACYVE